MLQTDDVLEMSNFRGTVSIIGKYANGFNPNKMLQIDSSLLTALREKLASEGARHGWSRS